MPTLKPINTDWTPDLVTRLVALFNDGVSFAHIASELAMTRAAIIGKCNRLGLRRDPPVHLDWNVRIKNKRRSDPSKNKTLVKLLAGPKVNSELFPSTPQSDLDIPKHQRKMLFTLTPHSCKFPVGDPQSKDFFFCGARKLPLLPYCAEHARRCFPAAKGLDRP